MTRIIDQLDKKAGLYSMLPEGQLQGMQAQGMQQMVRGVSPQLLELLAVQSAIQTKNAAKNNLIAAQQQNAQTVKDQKENELLEQSRQEMGLPSQRDMAMGVLGALANKQRRASRNMQAMAKLDPRMLQAMAKQRGIATNPRPNMRQMAEGGVVGYSQGGDVQEPIKLFAGALLKGIPAAGRFLAPYAKKLFTRPRTMERVTEGKMGQAAKDLGYLPKGQFKAPGFRQFSPGRTALTGVGIASLLSPFFMEDEEKTDMEVPKTDDADAAPTAPATDLGPTQMVDREAETKDRDKAFRRLTNILTAPGGFKNMARADERFYQKELRNELAEKKQLIEEESNKLTAELAKTQREQLDYSKLMTRMNAIQGQINDITKDVMNSPLGIMYQANLDKIKDDPNDESLKAEIKAQEQLIEAAIVNRAQAFQGDGGVGLFGQLKAIQRLLYAGDIDTSKPPKQV